LDVFASNTDLLLLCAAADPSTRVAYIVLDAYANEWDTAQLPPHTKVVSCDPWTSRGWAKQPEGRFIVRDDPPAGLMKLVPETVKHVAKVSWVVVANVTARVCSTAASHAHDIWKLICDQA
jgi:hypothetical protein